MIQASFFFFFPSPGAKGAFLCDMLLHGVGTWLAPLGKKTEQVAKRRKQGRVSARCEHAAGVVVACNGKRLKKKQPLHTFKDTSKHNYIWDILQEDPIWLCVFVVVFAIVADSQFFMVAGLSVGAVKHSGVFSCDWDSLEEESVRHGAWLSVCWSSSGGLGENGGGRQSPVKPPSSIQPAPSCPFSPLLFICSAALSSILFSLLSSISQQGFISCDSVKPIISSPTNLHPQPAFQQQHTTTRSKPQEGRQLDWCLSKNPLLLTCVANPRHHVCCGYCKSLTVLCWTCC